MKKIDRNLADIEQYQLDRLEDAQVCVVSFGGTARCRAGGDRPGALGRLQGRLLPAGDGVAVPDEALSQICDKVEHIIVAELNYGQMKLEVERVARGRCQVHHIGKVNGTILKPSEIYKLIREVAR